MTDLTQFVTPWSRERCIAYVQEQNAIAEARLERRFHEREVYSMDLLSDADALREAGFAWKEIARMLDCPNASSLKTAYHARFRGYQQAA